MEDAKDPQKDRGNGIKEKLIWKNVKPIFAWRSVRMTLMKKFMLKKTLMMNKTK